MKLVTGYFPDLDKMPRIAKKWGLTKRSAFVLESYRPDRTDMYFDYKLYVSILELVQKVVEGDTIFATISKNRYLDIPILSGLIEMINNSMELREEPLENVLFYKNKKVVAVVGSEPWAYVGGPQPYNDSYTVPVFTGYDVSASIQEETQKLCDVQGAVLTSIIKGNEYPKIGAWRKIANYFGIHQII